MKRQAAALGLILFRICRLKSFFPPILCVPLADEAIKGDQNAE